MLRLTILALLLLPAQLAAADMDSALDLVDLGDQAHKEKKYDEAAVHFRKAIEEDDACLPAHRGLGEALLASGKLREALVAFRMCTRRARAGAVPTRWRTIVDQAHKRLRELDERGNELESLIDKHVAALMRLATKYHAKDPDLAARAVASVLTLRPEHERALKLREKMSAKGALREAVFDGKQIDDWDGGRGKWWSVKDGLIRADTKGVATFCRTQAKQFEGNFDVLMEARIVKGYGRSPFLALLGAWTAEYDHSRLGTLSGALSWFEHRGEGSKERVFRSDAKRLKPPYDPSAWTVYELRYRDTRIEAFVNGTKVHSIDRAKERTGGFVGILAQECLAEIKRVEVIHR